MNCELCGELDRWPRTKVDGLLLCVRCAKAAEDLSREVFDLALSDYRDRMAAAGSADPAITFID